MKADIAEKRSSKVGREVVERSVSSFWFWLLLLGILLLASVLRLYALGTYPQRFNQDGMVIGYEGWSIWTTGRDQHGVFFPVFFQSFNAYDVPVADYVTAPFVGILGLSEESTCLPFALMGIATVFLVALLGRRWFNAAAGLLAALLLTIDPWHINYSRIAHYGSSIPFFTVVGLYCFTRGISLFVTKKQKRLSALLWLAGSALSFAFLTGTYRPMILETPLLLCACAIAARPFVVSNFSRLRWADVFIWLILYCLFVSPLALTQVREWNLAQAEFKTITVFNQPNWLALFFTQYANSYNPGALLFTGFGSILAVLPQGVGLLFWLEGPLLIFAVIGMSQQRHLSRQVGFVLPTLLAIWFITFPIASSLTTPSPHEIRTYNVVPLPEILAGYGAVIAWDIAGRYRWKWFSTGIAILLIFNLIFLSFFFSAPLLQTDATINQIPYNVGLRSVLSKVMPQVKPCDTVWLEPVRDSGDSFDSQTYIYFLFLTRYPPALFQATAHQGKIPWDWYTSLGQVHFAIPSVEGSSSVSLPAGCRGKPSRLFFITRTAQTGPGWQQVIAVSNRAGLLIWQVFVKTT